MVVFSTIGAGDPLMVEPEGPHFSTISAGDPLMVRGGGFSGFRGALTKNPAWEFAQEAPVSSCRLGDPIIRF